MPVAAETSSSFSGTATLPTVAGPSAMAPALDMVITPLPSTST
jgi:hypothetical protein